MSNQTPQKKLATIIRRKLLPIFLFKNTHSSQRDFHSGAILKNKIKNVALGRNKNKKKQLRQQQ